MRLYSEEGSALKQSIALVARVKRYGWTEEERRKQNNDKDPLCNATETSIGLIAKKTRLSGDEVRRARDSLASDVNTTLDEMVGKITSYEPATSRQTSFNDKGEFKG